MRGKTMGFFGNSPRQQAAGKAGRTAAKAQIAVRHNRERNARQKADNDRASASRPGNFWTGNPSGGNRW